MVGLCVTWTYQKSILQVYLIVTTIDFLSFSHLPPPTIDIYCCTLMVWMYVMCALGMSETHVTFNNQLTPAKKTERAPFKTLLSIKCDWICGLLYVELWRVGNFMGKLFFKTWGPFSKFISKKNQNPILDLDSRSSKFQIFASNYATRITDNLKP